MPAPFTAAQTTEINRLVDVKLDPVKAQVTDATNKAIDAKSTAVLAGQAATNAQTQATNALAAAQTANAALGGFDTRLDTLEAQVAALEAAGGGSGGGGGGGGQPTISPPTIAGAIATPSSLPVGGGTVVIDATVGNAISTMLDGLPVQLPVSVQCPMSHTFELTANGVAGTSPATADIAVSVASAPPSPGTFPAWRSPTWAKDTVHEIAGTAGMAGDMPGPFPGRPTQGGPGKTSADTDTWNGWACDRKNAVLWGFACGGDGTQWSNKVYKLDLMAAIPQYNFDRAADGTAIVGTSEAVAKASAAGAYYSDGKPQSKQTYNDVQWVGALNRCLSIKSSAPFILAAKYDVMDGYQPGVGFDAAGTWPSSALLDDGGNTLVWTVAQNPGTEDIVATGVGGHFRKFSVASKTWSTWCRIWQASWNFRGALIDVKRDRMCYVVGNVLDWISNLEGAGVHGTATITSADPNFVTDANGDYTALVLDEDGDRYLLFVGEGNAQAGLKPGRIYAIDPDTHEATKIADVPAPFNGWNSRVKYMPTLGGVVFLPYYAANLSILVTREAA